MTLSTHRNSSGVEARGSLRCWFCFMKALWLCDWFESLRVLSQNGDVCISILHPPVDDPQSGELPSERWNPTQNVRYGVISNSQTCLIIGIKSCPLCSLIWPFSTKQWFFFLHTHCVLCKLISLQGSTGLILNSSCLREWSCIFPTNRIIGRVARLVLCSWVSCCLP